MEIKPYSSLQEFYAAIDPLLEKGEWTGVTIEKMEKLIQLNLRLLVKQTENKETAQILQSKLQQLSDRINENFTQAAAHNLAFRLQGIAQGIFSKQEEKVDFNRLLPDEIKQKILSELTPKGKQVRQKRIISSDLKDARLTSKQLEAIAKETKKAWVNEEIVSLKTYGCKNADEAINYVIENKLVSANLLDFEGITDEHIEKLVKACPNLQHLFINGGVVFSKVTDKALESLKGARNLKSVIFNNCDKITDKGLEVFKDMPLLTSVDFSYCPKLTDKGLENFNGKALTAAHFSMCLSFTDKGLENFKGMPLTDIAFSGDNITDKGLENFKGMPLTNVYFMRCDNITNKGIENFNSLPLPQRNFKFVLCPKISKQEGIQII